jgi:hypothetical protein
VLKIDRRSFLKYMQLGGRSSGLELRRESSGIPDALGNRKLEELLALVI